MRSHESTLEINTTAQGPATLVALSGSIDTLTADDLLEVLQTQITAGNARLVGDMSGVEYTSSAGLRALLAAMKEARRSGGDLRLAAVTDRVHKVLQLSGFTTILRLYPDVDSAIESFTS
jgi:anti-sigma B factor antagonist